MCQTTRRQSYNTPRKYHHVTQRRRPCHLSQTAGQPTSETGTHAIENSATLVLAPGKTVSGFPGPAPPTRGGISQTRNERPTQNKAEGTITRAAISLPGTRLALPDPPPDPVRGKPRPSGRGGCQHSAVETGTAAVAVHLVS